MHRHLRHILLVIIEVAAMALFWLSLIPPSVGA